MTNKTEDIELRLLLDAIHQKYDYDFRGYATASMKRRIELARTRFECHSISMLQDRILHEPTVFAEFLTYLTIQVSEMFRDPLYYREIREKIIPELRTYPSLKVWVAGCADGEELYSLSILFREEGLESRTMFYATDISTDALRRAQAGIYPLDRIALFSQNYLKAGGKDSLSSYYTAAYDGALFDRTLRKRTVFSDHSLVTDSVFAEMQLISCRNVLIYFDRPLQDRAIGLFKDALSRRAFLGLGSKESLRFSAHADEFNEFCSEARIYQKRGNGP
ncbi:CheR family methyltransferase [Lacunimicrobium album]